MSVISKEIEWAIPSSKDADGAASNPPNQTELLIRRCLAGDHASYSALYQLYATYIYRLVYSLLQNREDAEEVLQDSFEYAFRKLSHFDSNKSQFKTWLYRIAVSRSRNKRRRKLLPTFSIQQTNDDNPQADQFEIVDHASPEPEEVAELSGQQQVVWDAIGELSTKLRETVILRHYEGMSYIEIGEILQVPPKTAESRMRLAHKALREKLEGKL